MGHYPRSGIFSPLLEPLSSRHRERDGGKSGRREREGLTATALSPGWVERNENLPSSFLWVFRSRSCLPGRVTRLHSLCALLCVCCCHRRCTPSCHFAARSRSLSRLSLSSPLPLFIIYGGLLSLSHAACSPCGSSALRAG